MTSEELNNLVALAHEAQYPTGCPNHCESCSRYMNCPKSCGRCYAQKPIGKPEFRIRKLRSKA